MTWRPRDLNRESFFPRDFFSSCSAEFNGRSQFYLGVTSSWTNDVFQREGIFRFPSLLSLFRGEKFAFGRRTREKRHVFRRGGKSSRHSRWIIIHCSRAGLSANGTLNRLRLKHWHAALSRFQSSIRDFPHGLRGTQFLEHTFKTFFDKDSTHWRNPPRVYDGLA